MSRSNKNDSSGMRGLMFGSEPENNGSITNNHRQHQNNPGMRQPPPFMTDPEFDNVEQIDSAYKLKDR